MRLPKKTSVKTQERFDKVIMCFPAASMYSASRVKTFVNKANLYVFTGETSRNFNLQYSRPRLYVLPGEEPPYCVAVQHDYVTAINLVSALPLYSAFTLENKVGFLLMVKLFKVNLLVESHCI